MSHSDDEFGWDGDLEHEILESQDNDFGFGWTESAETSLLALEQQCNLESQQTAIEEAEVVVLSDHSSELLAVATPAQQERNLPADLTAQSEHSQPTITQSDQSITAQTEKLPETWQFTRADGRIPAAERPRFFSHKLYRGPKDERVSIHYCSTREQSEVIAQLFINEPMLGFDMEWKARECRNAERCKRRNCHGLQQRISLIQLASGADVALFHLGLMPGSRPYELLVPSLRRILEDPSIIKTGVAVNKADGARLRRYFDVKPRGLIELSEMHRVVTHWPHDLHAAVSKGLLSLKALTAIHLRLPLDKDHSVRASDWSKPLTQKHVEYAANDAYVGFQLYRWLELTRRRMQPLPPHPHFCETYRKIKPADYGFEYPPKAVKAAVQKCPETAVADSKMPTPRKKGARAQPKSTEPTSSPPAYQTQVLLKESSPQGDGEPTPRRKAAFRRPTIMAS